MSKYEAGILTLIDPSADKPLAEIPTVQCVHCGCHFPEPRFEPDKRATRIGRGYCTRCGGFICGKSCAKCVPVEQYLENVEAGRPVDWVRVIR